MTLETISGYAWEHNEKPVSSALHADLWFRPVQADTVHGLMTNREVKANLNPATGAFNVQLERDVKYVPEMRWLFDSSDWDEYPGNRSSQICQWPAFTVVSSGDISDQPADGPRWDRVWVSLADPPAGFRGYWLVSDPSVTPTTKGAEIGELRRVY